MLYITNQSYKIVFLGQKQKKMRMDFSIDTQYETILFLIIPFFNPSFFKTFFAVIDEGWMSFT